MSESKADMGLFWGCFIALIATSFGFIARVLTANEWAAEFALSETQKGEILGVGLWPFAISIVLFSFIIDRIGYKAAMYFGLVCHVTSTVLILTAQGYWGMYLGTLVLALGSGTVEAYINPVVATMFNKNKTKWLNILHAGWPGGLAIGGIIAILLGSSVPWRVKIGLILIPTVIYIFMLMKKSFPTNERVAAGISYKDMLKEVGAIGALIITAMVSMEVGRVFGWGDILIYGIIAASTIGFAVYTRSAGNWLFILFLLIMFPLATTELGVDSWITSLMEESMGNIGINAGWVLVYTSVIMMVLRFYAGPIVHRISPLGLLAMSAVLAALGLVFLSKATGGMILAAATLYGIGKSFFWPTTLGVVAEQFPRGGALTLNAVAAVGMLAVGIVGAPFLGFFQDQQVSKEIKAYDSAVHTEYVSIDKDGLFGKYKGLDAEKLAVAPEEVQAEVTKIQGGAQKGALSTIAVLPVIMLVIYLLLLLYFRSKGGYKPVELEQTE